MLNICDDYEKNIGQDPKYILIFCGLDRNCYCPTLINIITIN